MKELPKIYDPKQTENVIIRPGKKTAILTPRSTRIKNRSPL